MKFIYTPASRNVKTGPIPVTYSPSSTCPSACSLKNAGCYAEAGHTNIQWKRLDKNQIGVDWDTLIFNIKKLPKNQLWRHNVAGDLPGDDNVIDNMAMHDLVEANRGKRGFTFTHKPVGLSGYKLVNARIVRASNLNGFTVNLSADNLIDADRKAEIGCGPVVVVVESDAPRHMKTPKGKHVIVCPAEYKEDMTCSRCGLCANPFRKAIIAFRAHGVRKNKVNKRLKVIHNQSLSL